MKILKQVQQPDDSTCVSASIACLTGLPIEQVVDEFHGRYMKGEIEASDYLKSSGYTVRDCYSAGEEPKPGRLYMAIVPSLNVIAGQHSVIFDLQDGYFKVIDPNEGREGKNVYVWKRNDKLREHEINVVSYCLELETEL